MTYLKVRWIHQYPDEPIVLFSELDDKRYELRKVEEYLDGRITFADSTTSSGETRLGELPVPSLSEITQDPQFAIEDISAAEFESVWKRAKA